MSTNFNLSRRIDEAIVQLGMSQAPSHQREALKSKIQELVEIRVGTALSSALSDRQLDEFADAVQVEDDASALELLQKDLPGYSAVTIREVEKVMSELDGVVTRLIAAREARKADQ